MASACNKQYVYSMDKASRGTVIIINNTFKDSKRYLEREAEHDGTRIHATLKDLGFDNVEHKKDLSKDEMLKILIETAKNMTESDCFMCVIMSYGEQGLVYGNDEKPVELKKLMEPFKGNKCKTLAGQPKIFIVQACPLREQNVADNAGDIDVYKTQKIPVEADFLIVFSTIPGYFGWESEKISWFINSLSEALDEYGESLKTQKMNFLRLMTRVNSIVVQKYENKPYVSVKVPLITSLLTKFIYFPDK